MSGTMNEHALDNAGAIEARAVEWRLRRERPDWDERNQAELDAWLAESTAHRVAWLRIEYGWQQVEHLATATPEDAPQWDEPEQPADLRPGGAPPAPEIGVRLRFSRSLEKRAAGKREKRSLTPISPISLQGKARMGAAAATILLTIAAGFFAATQAYKWAPGFYETEIGARQIVALADGSRVELNTDTELRATVDDTRRVVRLYQGEAFFDVASDPGRPFIVHAGDRRVVVLGTQFSVRRDRDRVQVTVAEGRVRVEREKPDKPAAPVVAERGEIVIAKAEIETLIPPAPERIERALAWRQGHLMFEKSTLAEAAAEFNRYNHRKLLVDDPAAATTRISGRFDANNLDAFLRLLQRAYGLQIEQDGDRLRVSG